MRPKLTPEQIARQVERRRERKAAMSPEERAEYSARQTAWKREWRRLNPDKADAIRLRKMANRHAAAKARMASLEAERAARSRAMRSIPPGEFFRRLNAAIPARIRGELRDDVAGEMAIQVLDGMIDLDGVGEAARLYLNRETQLVRYGPASLDALIPGTDLRIGDTVAADAFHF